MSDPDELHPRDAEDAVLDGLLRTDFGRAVDTEGLLAAAVRGAAARGAGARGSSARVVHWRRALPLTAAALLVICAGAAAFRMGAGFSALTRGLPEEAAAPWGSLRDQARFAFDRSTGGATP